MVVEINLDAGWLLHSVVVAIAAFAIAGDVRSPALAGAMAYGVAFAASFAWRMVTPALTTIWDSFLHDFVSVLSGRGGSEDVFGFVTFWLLPLVVAYSVAKARRTWFPHRNWKTWTIFASGLVLLVVAFLLAVRFAAEPFLW